MNLFRPAAFVFVLAGVGLTVSAQPGLPLLSQPIPNQIINRGVVEIDLKNHFGVSEVTGQVVQFTTSGGKVNVELRANEAPRQVANFLSYIAKTAYDNTIFHRVDNLGTALPAIIQGGAYPAAVMPPVPAPIITSASVPLEYRLPNTRGTLAAFHKQGDPNSATSEWFFNVLDNTNALGQANDSGFTVFGRVLSGGMSVVDTLSQMGTVSIAGSALTQLPVRNLTAGQTQLTPANLAAISTVRVVPIYPPATGDPSAVLSFSVTQSTQGAGTVAVTVTGSTLKLTPLGEGTVSLTVRAVDSNGATSLPTTFTITVPPGSLLPPVFKAQPQSQTVTPGTTVVFSAQATGGESGLFPLQYDWRYNGVSLRLPSSPFLVLRKVVAADAGKYTCVVSNALTDTLSAEATLTVVPSTPAETGHLVNLAVRTNAGILDEMLIVGFGLGGGGTSGPAPLLVRGVGPTLTQFGVTDALADPIISVFQNRNTIATNDNWDGNAQVAERSTQVGAFAFNANTSLDSALALTSNPGAYTLQISGAGGSTGTALAEIYDVTPNAGITDATPRLINASARAQVGASNFLIAGFVIGGTRATTVLIRAVGPTLGVFGVAGALADPKLQLYNATSLVREDDNWGGDPQLAAAASSVGAFNLDSASKDSVILVTLPPGAYTALVSGVGGSEGVALVELYELR
jgi:cyclophilin family peptidyl-prolyl cis-trans isomerase